MAEDRDGYLARLDAAIRLLHAQDWNDKAAQAHRLAGLVEARNLYAHPDYLAGTPARSQRRYERGLAEALAGDPPAVPAGHEYLVRVGDVCGDTPQEVRERAIDAAVNDVPDAGARYDIVPGYVVQLQDQGKMAGQQMSVKVTVAADRACWLAPASQQEVRRG